MDARIVRVRDLDPGDEMAWRALAAEAAEPNPFYEPDCIIPAAHHQSFGDEIEMVFAEEAGRFYAGVPVRQVRRWRRIRYPFVVTQVRRMIYCGTPLVSSERGDEAMAAILTALRGRRRLAHGRVLVLQELAADGPAARAVDAGAGLAGLSLRHDEPWERGVLMRRPGGDYLAAQDRRFRQGLQRRWRRLSEELGDEPQVVDRSNDPAAIDEFLAMEASGYKGLSGVATTTVPGEPDYFRDMCLRYAAQGRLRILALEGGGRTVAMNLSLRGERACSA